MPKSEILSYGELERYLELAGSLKRVMSQEMRGQIERGPQLTKAFSLIQQAEESIREEMREVRYDLLKKSWKPMAPETEMEPPETPETPVRFRTLEKFANDGPLYGSWQDEGPGPLDIREG